MTHLSLPAFSGKKIGILGGSFNPAHEGHLYISLYAIKNLGLDEVWWLVSPQNPLKPKTGMAPYSKRLAGAKAIVSNLPCIKVLDLEKRLGLRYTVDTVAALKKLAPTAHFVLLLGADAWRQLDKWRRWKRLFQLVPIAVFQRPGYAVNAASCRAGRVFAAVKKKTVAAETLVSARPPAWLVMDNGLVYLSGTEIRRKELETLLEERNSSTCTPKTRLPGKTKKPRNPSAGKTRPEQKRVRNARKPKRRGGNRPR